MGIWVGEEQKSFQAVIDDFRSRFPTAPERSRSTNDTRKDFAVRTASRSWTRATRCRRRSSGVSDRPCKRGGFVLTESEFSNVLQRVPELQAGLADHFDEVLRIATRILETERRDPPPTLPWAGLPDGERAIAFDARYPRASCAKPQQTVAAERQES
jgi:hypothetical protein